MTQNKPRTSAVNGRLCGGHAHDWASIQEGQCSPVYHAVLERVGLSTGDSYLDIGCGSGMAAQFADQRKAKVFGVDASSARLDIVKHRVPGGNFQI
ncbi:class I SAM-dependent methyltransferase [Echinimonas agarilytica]|uniref:Class I SAM-dependent methyltransferase n=1 Tax=Echinimonas agarilytica TaxID=1215918 RepID=A0AA41W8U6_9GAMM|nr:class I SAM-dependent methyltransferase [Echinimonas agarilytica]MCM2680672.1 class I SAM-dependent methyltransferase [Echinimonas agarilytica]